MILIITLAVTTVIFPIFAYFAGSDRGYANGWRWGRTNPYKELVQEKIDAALVTERKRWHVRLAKRGYGGYAVSPAGQLVFRLPTIQRQPEKPKLHEPS